MVNIHCILGRVSSPSPDVVVDESKAVANSSKWIFDVQLRSSGAFEITLLNFLGGMPRPKCVLAPHFCPLNQQAAESLIWFPDPDKMLVQISTDEAEDGHAFFRVTVDALHSLMR
jgi:hypothetical protein